jgi:hypothetical protein
MNGNYEVDFGQGRMKYISECTLQEILSAREIVRDRSQGQIAIQREIEMLLQREEFSNIEDWTTDNVRIEARADEGGQLISAETQVVQSAPQAITALHTQTQWL